MSSDLFDVRDRARLDWLEEMARQPGGLLLHSELGPPGRKGLGMSRRSLREAIDQAAGAELEAAPRVRAPLAPR